MNRIDNALISVSSRKDDTGGDPEILDFMTSGSYEVNGTEAVIVYQESAVTGMEGTTTTIRVNPGSVILIRTGKLSSMLVFEEGKTHSSGYDTEYGTINVGVATRRVSVKLDERGGRVEVDYIIEFNSAFGGRNSITVDVKRKM